MYTVTTGNPIVALDINQTVNVLKQPASGTESGRYVVAGNCYASGAYISVYYPSLSRVSTPVSVTLGTVNDPSPTTNLAAPSTDHLTASGCQIFAGSSASILNASAGGSITIQY